ncbi:outer membrane protein assembly factor BamB family protein [Stratiformator vulcanicus]|uniref:Outer membrane biogenesis protein BamB n=1 Tax=Stratiformator vulcanicus TaxID=2527980 RepID=A0A517R6R6_9PLAN|nr:PQQ-binding-like beta-propeller repeat protein [Stratiformator vulcanicus]QDT39578.1 outer membrane biogenesis protein BamB [Stratiformator vulcanicus]
MTTTPIARLFILAAAIVFLGCGRPQGGGPGGATEEVTEIKTSVSEGKTLVADDDPYMLSPAKPGVEIEPDAKHGWPQWRGPNRNGVAPNVSPPLEWSADNNVIWSSKVPGRGHSSPTVYGGQVYLATADEQAQAQSLLAFDAETGEPTWSAVVSKGGFPPDNRMHPESSFASSTPATDGERVYISFLHDAAIFVSAFSLSGEPVWGEVDAGPFDSRFGYAPSPVLYGPYVIITGDHSGGGFIAALDRATGEVVWRTARPEASSYATPLIVTMAGRAQAIIGGADRIASFDPASGDELWSIDGTTEAVAGTAVYAEGLAIASGGYPGSETLAVSVGDTPKPAWRERSKAYVPSLLAKDDLLFLVSDKGQTWCFDVATGEEQWKTRLRGSLFRASPVWADGHVLATNHEGLTHVFKATGSGFESVTENQLGEEMYSSITVVGDRLYLRVADGRGPQRQETLYCVGGE